MLCLRWEQCLLVAGMRFVVLGKTWRVGFDVPDWVRPLEWDRCGGVVRLEKAKAVVVV